MASLRKEIQIQASPEDVWAAIRDGHASRLEAYSAAANGWVEARIAPNDDGASIVFASNSGWNQWTNGSASTTANLFTVKTDGTGLTQVTTGIATSARDSSRQMPASTV